MSDASDPERTLALSYAPLDVRRALAALLALDATLGQVLRSTREPLVGQMRLTWWFEALVALDTAPPPPEPVLRALAADVLPRGVTGAELAGMIDGWEALLDPEPLSHDRIGVHAHARGETLFAQAGQMLGADARDPLAAAGRGWALGDLTGNLRGGEAAGVRVMALADLDRALHPRWSACARPLGALALIARMNLADPASRPGAPRRVARLAWHRLTGR